MAKNDRRPKGGGARVYWKCSRCPALTSNGSRVCTACLNALEGRSIDWASRTAARRVAASYDPAGEAEARLRRRITQS